MNSPAETLTPSGPAPAPAHRLEPVLLHERCLIGALIMAADTRKALARMDAILPPGLITPGHAPVVVAIRALSDKGMEANLVGVSAELSARGELDRLGGAERLVGWVEGTPDIDAIEEYSRAIAEYRHRLQAQALANEISRKAAKGESIDGDVAKLQEEARRGTSAAPTPPDWKACTRSEVVPLNSLAGLIDFQVDYLLRPALIRGCLTQLHGAPKGGKSVFALYTSLAVAVGNWSSGVWDLPEAVSAAGPPNVLYISFEDSPLLIVQRAYKYLNGMGYDGRTLPANFHLCDNPALLLDTDQGNELLRNKIAEIKADLIVIDTLSYIHQAEDENSSADVKPLMANLKRIVRELNVSILYIHHSRKGGSGAEAQESASVERARGSSVISAAADVIIDWGNRNGSNTTPVRLISKYDEGYDFRVLYVATDSETVTWKLERQDPLDLAANKQPSAQENANSVMEMMKIIAGQGCIRVPGSNVTKIMADQGMSRMTVNRTLHKLVADGLISATPQGAGKATLYQIIDRVNCGSTL